MTRVYQTGTLAGMLGKLEAIVAGLLVGASVASVSLTGCLSPAERRALTVADCVAQKALELPDRELPANPWEVTGDDLALAIEVFDGVRACRRMAPDGGP